MFSNVHNSYTYKRAEKKGREKSVSSTFQQSHLQPHLLDTQEGRSERGGGMVRRVGWSERGRERGTGEEDEWRQGGERGDCHGGGAV